MPGTNTGNVETWQNAAKGMSFIWKFDRRGEPTDEVVPAGAKFSLSTEERLYNQERAYDQDSCNFRNGTFVPVRLLDGTEDKAEIASNPNLLSEDDMRGLFKGHWKTFESKVGAIKNLTALERLRDIAKQEDATVRQVQIIEDRIEAVTPKPVNLPSQEAEKMPSGPIAP